MKINKKYIVAVLIILAAGVIYISQPRLYGNDKESIIKVIQSIEGYENGSIEILDIKDIEDIRVASFLYNHSPSNIQFQKDKHGNYKWQNIEKHSNDSLASFLIRTKDKVMFLFVANDENNIAKMQIDVNGTIMNQEFDVHRPSAVWMDLPESDHGYTFKYKYFDKDGNLMP